MNRATFTFPPDRVRRHGPPLAGPRAGVRSRLGGRACRDHATPSVVEPVETTPALGGRACRDHAAWFGLGAAGSKNFSKKFPGPLWRTPFSGPECRWSVLELGHDREHRRPRHRRRGAGRGARGPVAWWTPAEARMLQAAVAWAAMHSVDSLAEAATVWDHGETGMPVAGPGAPAGRGVLGDRVRRRDRAAHRGRQGLPRRGRRAPLPPPPGLVPGDQGRPARLAGPPGRPRDHRSCPWRPPRTSTATSPTSRTRSAPPSSTGSSRRRSGGSCPRRPNAAAGRPPTAGPSPSTPGNPPWPAPAPCTGSSTWPTPSTSTPPSPPAPRR